jgi:putative ABC transport system permease protein
MVESVALALIGGVIGAVITYFVFNGISASTLGGASFTQVVFSFAVTPASVVSGLVLALIVGFLGGVVPAIRAANAPLLAVHG